MTNKIVASDRESWAINQAAERARSMRAQAEANYEKRAHKSASMAEKTRWTFSSVKVLDANGAVKRQATGSFFGGTEDHAEEAALKRIDPTKLAPGDTVIIYTDQFACERKCVPFIEGWTKKTSANVRVFSSAVRTTEPLPAGGTRDVATGMKSVATGCTTKGVEIIEDLSLQRVSVQPMAPTVSYPGNRVVIAPELEPSGTLTSIAVGLLLNVPLSAQDKAEEAKWNSITPEIQRGLEALRPEIEKLAAASPEATVWANITVTVERDPLASRLDLRALTSEALGLVGGPIPPPSGPIRRIVLTDTKISTHELSGSTTRYETIGGGVFGSRTDRVTYSIPVGGVNREILEKQLMSKAYKVIQDLPRRIADYISGGQARDNYEWEKNFEVFVPKPAQLPDNGIQASPPAPDPATYPALKPGGHAGNPAAQQAARMGLQATNQAEQRLREILMQQLAAPPAHSPATHPAHKPGGHAGNHAAPHTLHQRMADLVGQWWQQLMPDPTNHPAQKPGGHAGKHPTPHTPHQGGGHAGKHPTPHTPHQGGDHAAPPTADQGQADLAGRWWQQLMPDPTNHPAHKPGGHAGKHAAPHKPHQGGGGHAAPHTPHQVPAPTTAPTPTPALPTPALSPTPAAPPQPCPAPFVCINDPNNQAMRWRP